MISGRLRALFMCVALMTCGWLSVSAEGARADVSAGIEALLPAVPEDQQGPYGTVGQFVAALYASRSYAPIWETPDLAAEALAVIERADLDGLEPEDYGFSALKADLARAPEADLDVRLTRALIALGRDLRFGKVAPSDVGNQIAFDRSFQSDPFLAFEAALAAGKLSQLITDQRPELPYYSVLREALLEYRDIQADGGWPRISKGPTLRLGDSGPRVSELAARLGLDAAVLTSDGMALFDDGLEQAVIAFQSAHGLEPDGLVGPATLAEMNVSVDQRIDQLRVNLERARWVGSLPEGRLILVNIPGFYASVVDNGENIWSTRVIVGTDYTETPVFQDEMSYLEFNPTWTAPRSIIRGELAPKVIADPGYLARNDYYLATSDGRPVATGSVDWSRLSAARFPYWIVQKPGDKNALGRVKFMFPNEHSVYLHDTPQRALFSLTRRSFSHGCIRVENPMELAELLLAGQGWDRARIDATVASGKITRVPLDAPVPIAILYWTVDPAGEALRFYPDIYRRDARVLAALEGPPRP